MESSETIYDFVLNFYSFFIDPIFSILRETDLLGFPLFNWVFGLTVLSIAVRFLRDFLGSNDEK